jgi:hypothetical protein
MSYVQWRNAYTFSFVHLGIILILVLRFYSGLSGRVRTVYPFSLCVVSLLSSRFTASALVVGGLFLLLPLEAKSIRETLRFTSVF